MSLTQEDKNTFTAIKNFVNATSELYDTYGDLSLYNHLLNRTKITKEVPVGYHIRAFETFCRDNKDAILNRKEDDLKETCIHYKKDESKVHFDVKKVFEIASDDNKETKEQVHQAFTEMKGDDDDEDDLFTNIFNQVSETKETDMSQMMPAIMQIVTSQFSGAKKHDTKKLIKSAKKALDKLGDKIDSDGGNNAQIKPMLEMIRGLLNDLDAGRPLDLTSLMPMMTMLMSNINME